MIFPLMQAAGILQRPVSFYMIVRSVGNNLGFVLRRW